MSLEKIQEQLFNAIVYQKDTEQSLSWIHDHGDITPQERLSIYQFAYRERLKDCVREDFPLTCQLLSIDFDRLFEDMMNGQSSTQWNINGFTKIWAEFLQTSSIHDSLKEVARWEWLKMESFFKSYRKSKALYPLVRLSDKPLMELRLHDSVVLMETLYPLTEIEKNKLVAEKKPEFLVIWTQNDRVRYLSLSETEFLFLKTFSKYDQWDEIVEVLSASIEMDENLGALIQETITRFMKLGIFIHQI